MKEVEEILINCLEFSKMNSYNILAQLICTLTNFYQNSQLIKYSVNYKKVFKELTEFRKLIKFNENLEYYICGLIKVVISANGYHLL